MGKTSKPLNLLIDPSLAATQQVADLVAKGHSISLMNSGTAEYDLILGPNCWRMLPELLDYMDEAVKGARDVRYPTKPKGE